MSLRSGSVWLVLCALLIGTASAWALAPHDKAIGVQVEQKSNRAADAQVKAQADKGDTTPAPTFVSPAQTPLQQENAREHAKDGEDNGTEFWPAFAGYKVKITDSLIALFTLALTVFTGLLWRSTEKLWAAGERQMNLTRVALHSAETPYLVPIVRKFDPKRDAAPDTGEGFMSYRFRNCGRSPAIVLERYHSLGAINQTPVPMTFPPPQTNLFKTELIGPGDKSEVWRFKPEAVRDWTPADQTRAACLIGQIRYADVFGNQFVTNFCFLRNGWSGNWYASGVPACNERRQLTPNETVIAQARDRMPGQGDAET